MRERIQQDCDEAAFQRRALAVDSEADVKRAHLVAETVAHKTRGEGEVQVKSIELIEGAPTSYVLIRTTAHAAASAIVW